MVFWKTSFSLKRCYSLFPNLIFNTKTSCFQVLFETFHRSFKSRVQTILELYAFEPFSRVLTETLVSQCLFGFHFIFNIKKLIKNSILNIQTTIKQTMVISQTQAQIFRRNLPSFILRMISLRFVGNRRVHGDFENILTF